MNSIRRKAPECLVIDGRVSGSQSACPQGKRWKKALSDMWSLNIKTCRLFSVMFTSVQSQSESMTNIYLGEKKMLHFRTKFVWQIRVSSVRRRDGQTAWRLNARSLVSLDQASVSSPQGKRWLGKITTSHLGTKYRARIISAIYGNIFLKKDMWDLLQKIFCVKNWEKSFDK